MATLPPLKVTDKDAAVLRRWVRAGTTEQRMAQRARIVLAAAEGQPSRRIAAREGVSEPTVARWRHRYAAEGINGLCDRPRSGRPRVYGHDDRLAVVKQVTEVPPDPASRWTLAALEEALADTVGISDTQIHAILCDLDLKPWQSRSWLTSHDPDFWDKAADVCGLYLDPPKNALVLSVDEKTCIQAKAGVNPTKPAAPGLVERREFEYRRAGTTCLFAALDVHAGTIMHDTKPRNRSVDFTDFLGHLDRVTPGDLVLHVVVDNGSSHVAKATRDWLDEPERKGRFVIHHTPTHASWLNQVELFFSILTRRLIRRGEFASVDELVAKLGAFISDYNRTARPFTWTYEGQPLKAA